MEWIQQLLDSTNTPILTAFLLGILTAISPCPLVTNITAIGYLSRSIENRHTIFFNGLLYTFGRLIAYVGLSLLVVPLLRAGSSSFGVQKMIRVYGEQLLAPLLILIGVFLLFKDRINLPQLNFQPNAEGIAQRGSWGALLLGLLFALAFCPTSGVFFFGMLMPLSVVETEGYLLPIIFAIATGLPVLIVSWVLAYSFASLGNLYQRIHQFQKWINLFVGFLFLLVGVYYAVTYWF